MKNFIPLVLRQQYDSPAKLVADIIGSPDNIGPFRLQPLASADIFVCYLR
jgi:hypothetical protein